MKENQNGVINSLLLGLIALTLLFVWVVIFAVWAFNSRQDYRNNTDQKITAAVQNAVQLTQTKDAQQYAIESQQPLTTYISPQADGSITIKYPKTWSAYINEQDNDTDLLIDGYFQPGFVPSITSQTNTFALRLQVIQETYDQSLSQFTELAQQGLVTIQPYTPSKVPSVVGVIVNGQIENNIEGTMIILPLRTTTLELWTEASQYESDFNNNILPNFSFSP